MKGKIILEGVEFHAFHGLYEEEQKNGNHFLVDVRLDINFQNKVLHDDPSSILDYSKVLEIVQTEMSKPKKLLEAVVYGIIEALRKSFSGIEKIQIKLSKVNPPLKAKMRQVSVEMTWPDA